MGAGRATSSSTGSWPGRRGRSGGPTAGTATTRRVPLRGRGGGRPAGGSVQCEQPHRGAGLAGRAAPGRGGPHGRRCVRPTRPTSTTRTGSSCRTSGPIPASMLPSWERRPMTRGGPGRWWNSTFDGVGLTPQNKYRGFVNPETGLMEQWYHYRSAEDSVPSTVTGWTEWRQVGPIMLSPLRPNSRGEHPESVSRTSRSPRRCRKGRSLPPPPDGGRCGPARNAPLPQDVPPARSVFRFPPLPGEPPASSGYF